MRLLHRRVARVSAIVAALCLSVCIVAPAAVVHAVAPAGASSYVPVPPYRILDTRISQGLAHRVSAGENFTLTLTDVPPTASAVVLNLTVDGSANPGFVMVYPTGVPRPVVSSINVDGAGQTIANLVTVPIGTGGTVDVYSLMTTDLIADVQGYYTPAVMAQAGLFVPINPTRLIDTREPTSPHFGPLVAGEQINLDVVGRAAFAGVTVPADATAAALKVTVTESTAGGFWTVFPAGSARPIVSNLNVIGTGTTIANQVLARLAGGSTTVFTQTGGHLVIDLVGFFTGASAPASDVGLFVPVTPQRLLDSREPPLGALPGHNRTAQVPVAGRANLPATGIGAVVVNATVTDTVRDGFFSIWPAQTYRPTASSLNATHAGQIIANHVITPVSTGGLSFYTQNGAHLIVDISGWYTGTEVATVLPPHVPLTGPSGPPTTQPFKFAAVFNGLAVRWNPCRAIRYLVNLGGYGSSFRAVIAEAVERLEAATGLPLVPVGDTPFMPRLNNGGQFPTGNSELVIALGDPQQSDLVGGSIIGRASTVFNPATSEMLRASIVVNMVALNSDPWSSVGTGPVLLHELAHAVGLDHVQDPTQLMNASASSGGPTTYGAGDLTGLSKVGAAGGCTV
ncbi:MAG: hypothetical protein ABI706_05045 [Ilumatobacteraceae bacterium]